MSAAVRAVAERFGTTPDRLRFVLHYWTHREVCEGLNACTNHPRFHVWWDKDSREWVATGPAPRPLTVQGEEGFSTWGEAYTWASTQAALLPPPPSLARQPRPAARAPAYHYTVTASGGLIEGPVSRRPVQPTDTERPAAVSLQFYHPAPPPDDGEEGTLLDLIEDAIANNDGHAVAYHRGVAYPIRFEKPVPADRYRPTTSH